MSTEAINFQKSQQDTGLREEQLILSMLLFGQFHYKEVEPNLEELFFNAKEHKAIFSWIVQQNQRPLKATMLHYYLIEKYGYAYNYCSDLISNLLCIFSDMRDVPSLDFFNNISTILAKKRKGGELLSRVLSNISRISSNDADGISELLKKINNETGALINSWELKEETLLDIEKVVQSLDEWIASLETKPIKTPFHRLNQLTKGGFRPGAFVIVGARPSTGKTTFACNLCLHFALHEMKENQQIIFWTLEDSIQKHLIKCLNIYLQDDILEPMKRHTTDNLARAKQKFAKLPIKCSSKQLVIEELCNHIKQANAHCHCRAIIIDYSNKLHSNVKHNTRTEVMSTIASHLRKLASDCNSTIILLSQINRNSESRVNRSPQLHDLKESGALEESADIALLLHREYQHLTTNKPSTKDGKKHQEHLEDLKREENRAQLFVAKNKFGPIGSIDLYFYGESIGFSDNPKTEG